MPAFFYLIVISPGSKTDFEFLYDLQKKVKTIIFVLNKIDNIKEEEGETVESVIESLKSNYRKQFPDIKTVPEIWPVAAFKALEARTVPEKAEQEEISRFKTVRRTFIKIFNLWGKSTSAINFSSGKSDFGFK